MVDIHERFGLAPAAVGDHVLAAGCSGDFQGSQSLAYRALNTPRLRDYNSTFSLVLQYVQPLFYSVS